MLIQTWREMQESANITISGKRLCKLLIEEFERRFDYEFNSKIYRVTMNKI
jgi:hypothetical protein